MPANPLRYYDVTEIRLAMVMMLLLDAASIPLLFNDLVLVRDPLLLIAMVTARCAFIVACAAGAIAVLRNPRTKRYSLWLILATVLTVIVYVLASVTRPPTRLLSAVTPLVTIVYYYFLLPAPLEFRWPAAIVMSLSEILLTLFVRQLDIGTKITLVSVYLTINGIGVITSALRFRFNVAREEDAKAHDGLSPVEAVLRQAGLSPREFEVARCLLAGHSLFGIATQLHISENTVKTHTANLYRKLDVHSRLELFQKLHLSVKE
jgi:DNA-binding CsgD family transcriptional regulator